MKGESMRLAWVGALMGVLVLSATALACDGATADALATAMMVTGVEGAQKMMSSMSRDTLWGAYLVYGDQEQMKVWHTPGLDLESEQ